MKNAPVRTLAHIFKASRQIMDDAPALRSYIDGRARYGLTFKEEVQLLNGDGTGQNLLGLQPQATAFAVPDGMAAVANMTVIDRLRIAILQVILAEYPASAFVLNPIDWATIELTKDTQGRYIIGDPAEGVQPASGTCRSSRPRRRRRTGSSPVPSTSPPRSSTAWRSRCCCRPRTSTTSRRT